jgi:N-acetylglucosamine-6-phosphate deacetylase
LDRHENILWTVLNEPTLTAGIIPDGIHVSPALFAILHEVLTPARVYWTTDAMSAAGAPPGRYTIGEIEVAVGADQIVINPATNTFAGSALTPIEGIRRGAQMLNRPWQDVWDLFSVNPARLMGLSADLSPGSAAGFCLLR